MPFPHNIAKKSLTTIRTRGAYKFFDPRKAEEVLQRKPQPGATTTAPLPYEPPP